MLLLRASACLYPVSSDTLGSMPPYMFVFVWLDPLGVRCFECALCGCPKNHGTGSTGGFSGEEASGRTTKLLPQGMTQSVSRPLSAFWSRVRSAAIRGTLQALGCFTPVYAIFCLCLVPVVCKRQDGPRNNFSAGFKYDATCAHVFLLLNTNVRRLCWCWCWC